MRTKNERQHNIKNESHQGKKGKKREIREIGDDFDFADEWFDNDPTDIPSRYSIDYD